MLPTCHAVPWHLLLVPSYDPARSHRCMAFSHACHACHPPCTPWCRRVELHLQRPAPALPLAVRDAPCISTFSLVGRCPTPPLIFIQVRLAVRDLQPARCSPRSNAAYACHARVRLAPARVRPRHRGLAPELYSSLNEAVFDLFQAPHATRGRRTPAAGCVRRPLGGRGGWAVGGR